MAVLVTSIYIFIAGLGFSHIIFAISKIKALLDRDNAKRREALQVLPNEIIFKILDGERFNARKETEQSAALEIIEKDTSTL